jgi:hypothetical protein
MISRTIVTGVFRFLLVSVLTVVVLVGTTLLIAFALAWIRDTTWDNPPDLVVSMVCGLVAWVFVAAFHLRRETQSMPFSQRDQFIAKAKTVLQEMGYALASAQPNALWFRPRFHAYLFGGGIHIAIENREAKLTGPKMSLEIFRRCFRLFNHVQRVQVYLQEHRKFTDNVLKRVELRLRVSPEQLEAVRRNVIELLQKDGDVVCDLNVLVQSEKGIHENMLEFEIREWLRQQGIEGEIHKDLIQFVEVVQPSLEPAATGN